MPSLDGKGAALLGGRWNDFGLPAVYTAGSVALASLEVFVHLNRDLRLVQYLPTLILIGLDVPDELVADGPALSDDEALDRQFGSSWLRSGIDLGLSVPSHVVPYDRNIILNPLHPAMKSLQPVVQQTFSFDTRMGY